MCRSLNGSLHQRLTNLSPHPEACEECAVSQVMDTDDSIPPGCGDPGSIGRKRYGIEALLAGNQRRHRRQVPICFGIEMATASATDASLKHRQLAVQLLCRPSRIWQEPLKCLCACTDGSRKSPCCRCRRIHYCAQQQTSRHSCGAPTRLPPLLLHRCSCLH